MVLNRIGKMIIVGTVFFMFFPLPGCSILTGDSHWRRGEPADVTTAQIGWKMPKVMDKIGRPLHTNVGTGVHTSWEEWVYPTGSLFLHRQRLTHILPRGPDEPIPPKGQFGWMPKKKKPEKRDRPWSRGVR